MMKTKFMYPLLALIILLVSCEKFVLDEPSTKANDGNANVKIHVLNFDQQISNEKELATSRSGEQHSLSEICSRITFAIFENGEKLESITQTTDDKDFGNVGFNLDEGEYQLVVIAHNGKGNCNMTSPDKVKFANNKVTDTFYYYGTFEVTEEGTNLQIPLERAVAMFNLHINDEIPQNAKTIKFYYTGGSSTLDATTGYGCVNSKQTETLTLSTTTQDYHVFTFPHEEEKKLKFTISVLDASGKTIESKIIDNVVVRRNYITTYKGNLFTGKGTGEEGSGQISFQFDSEWEGEIVHSF